MPNRTPSIKLTEIESLLKRLLLDVASHIHPQNPSELRFTGGWVRDKLLGVSSHDIDVGINDMTGYRFGLEMKRYLDLPGNSQKYGVEDAAAPGNYSGDDRQQIFGSLHKIEANPEKSKHLETVTTKIFGLDVDLVNLRKETYTEQSRNPEMEFGTPEEDSLRREATINAMFFNLQTGLVEDFTGKGLDDLRDKIIRTPVEPFQTFKDDPLRILRVIRFASRLGYTIDQEAQESMQKDSIKQALKAKISRERVGDEVGKMLRGPNPFAALQFVDQLGLYDTIFIDPGAKYDFQPETQDWRHSYHSAKQLCEDERSATFQLLELDQKENAYLLWLLAAMVPWAEAPQQAATKTGGKIPPPAAYAVARNGLAAPNKICDIVSAAVKSQEDIIRVKDEFVSYGKRPPQVLGSSSPDSRDKLGMAVRRWGSTWKSQVAFALLLENTSAQGFSRNITANYTNFLSHLQNLGISQAYNDKPVLTGTQLASALSTKPGPWLKDALEIVMTWQLANPDIADTQGAIDAVRNVYDAPSSSKNPAQGKLNGEHGRQNGGELHQRLIDHILRLIIRPLFAQTKTQHSSSITPAGSQRQMLSQMQRSSVETDAEAAETRPWKDVKNEYALDLLDWVARSLDFRLVHQHWGILVPTILSLVDDVDVRFKARGCRLLKEMLGCTTSTLLASTGLGDVFKQALTPCLSYLPTLTPEEESILLLDAAYPALLALASARYGPQHPSPHHNQTAHFDPSGKLYIANLAGIIHEHLLPSLSHISSSASSSVFDTPHPRLTASLLTHLTHTITQSGQHTISQLSHLVPLLASILQNPFAASGAPQILSSASSAMQTVVANAWPRVWRWRAEIAGGLGAAYITVIEAREDDGCSGGDLGDVEEKLKCCAVMLLRAVKAITEDGPVDHPGVPRDVRSVGEGAVDPTEGTEESKEVDFERELKSLCDVDGRLEPLFRDA